MPIIPVALIEIPDFIRLKRANVFAPPLKANGLNLQFHPCSALSDTTAKLNRWAFSRKAVLSNKQVNFSEELLV
jgi:hypothetical protein